jgi:hypothetical protein
MSIRYCAICFFAPVLCGVGAAHAENTQPFDDFQIRRDCDLFSDTRSTDRTPPRYDATHHVGLRGSLRDEGQKLAALDIRDLSPRQGEALHPAPFQNLRPSYAPLDEDTQEFALRGRLLLVGTLPSGASRSSIGTGFGGEATLEWRRSEFWGPYIAANYAQVGGIAGMENPLTATALNGGGMSALSYSDIRYRSSFALATVTAGIFAEWAPFRLRAGAGAGYSSINASYEGVTQTLLLLHGAQVGARSTATGKEFAPARSFSFVGAAGLELDLVKAFELFGGGGILPRGLSADVGVEGIVGNAFLRPANTGSAPTRGPLGFLAVTGGASYTFSTSLPRMFRAAPLPPPPVVARRV